MSTPVPPVPPPAAEPPPSLATAQPAGVPAGAQPVVEVLGLVKGYGDHRVLDGIDLKVYRGETVVVMGGSGCGKSTLLRCLIGALPPDAGTIKLFGQDIGRLSVAGMDALRKRFGVLFQSGALYSSMSVGENVALPWKEHTNLDPAMIDLVVKVKLEQVGLREAEDLLPDELSGGMQKRAGLARAIALDPELLFYDEPTAGLDPLMAGTIDGLIVDLARGMNVTSVVVTHDMKSAFRIADRMVVLNDTKVVAEGTPKEITEHPDPFVKRFILGPAEVRTAVFSRSSLDKHPQ